MEEFFNLIKEKPIVDLQITSLNDFQTLVNKNECKNLLAELCQTNTSVREKVKVNRLVEHMFL